jgi:YHS domain-containing protein
MSQTETKVAMNLIRRSAWAAVMLGAVAGCTGGEDAGAPANNPAPAGESAVKGPMATGEPSREAPSKDMQPPPAPPENAEDTKKAGDQPKLEGPKAETKGDTAAAVKLTPQEIATIKELPAADQELALKQAVCPVSDEHLGGEMGKPYKISVEGRTVFLCCDSCEPKIKAEPKKYLAKLDGKASQK